MERNTENSTEFSFEQSNTVTIIPLNDQDIDVQLFFPYRFEFYYYYKGCFFDMPVLNAIKEKILKRESVLVTGDPLAGKTRIIYESLNEIRDARLIIPHYNKGIEKYEINLQQGDIFLFDDLQNYLRNNFEATESLLDHLILNRVQIISSCRVGPEYKSMKRHLNDNAFEFLQRNQIRIYKIYDLRSQVFEFHGRHRLNSSLRDFDGNIGSLILPLQRMKDRYAFLENNKEDVAIAILIGLKLHYHLFNYESRRNFFDENKIKNFCKIFLDRSITPMEWSRATQILESTHTEFNFIIRGEYLMIEEAYIECHSDSCKDVVAEQYDIPTIRSEFKNIYKTVFKQREAGFPISIGIWNSVLLKQEDYESAYEIFLRLPKSGRSAPNGNTHHILMKKAIEKETIIKHYKEIKKTFKVTHEVDSTFFGKFQDFEELHDLILEIEEDHHLNHKTNGGIRLIYLAKKQPLRSLEFLFAKYSLREIFQSYVFMEICLKCSESEFNLKDPIIEFQNEAFKLDKDLQKKFILIAIKLGLFTVAYDLLRRAFLDDLFFYNYIMGLSFEKMQPFSSLNSYLKCIDVQSGEEDSVEAYFRFCSLVYYKKMLSRTNEAISFCERLINDAKFSYNTVRIKKIYLLLIIQKTPIKDLHRTTLEYIRKPGIGKWLFKKILNDIEDDEKKKVIMTIFQ